MATKQRARRFSAGKRNGRFQWYTSFFDATNVGHNTITASDLLAAVDRDLLRGATVVRIRGNWAMRPITIDIDSAMTISIYLTTLEAFAGGIAFEAQNDEGNLLFTDTVYSEIASGTSGQQYINRVIDSKAKRKLKGGDPTIVLQRENLGVDVTTIVVGVNIKVLLWLP